MAKAKTKAGASIPNRHIHSRVSYLYQAAVYLKHASVNESLTSREADPSKPGHDLERSSARKSLGQPRYLLSHLRGVSRKAQTRIEPEIKRTICKHCDTLLIPGQTSPSNDPICLTNAQRLETDISALQCRSCAQTQRSQKDFPTRSYARHCIPESLFRQPSQSMSQHTWVRRHQVLWDITEVWPRQASWQGSPVK